MESNLFKSFPHHLCHSRITFVIPAKAGIQREMNKILDSRLRRELSRTLRSGMTSYLEVKRCPFPSFRRKPESSLFN